MSGVKRKRPRISWKDLPAFLDASASVSATTYGARRLPEIKTLWNLYRQEQTPTEEYRSGGCQTSSRHLRRRTTSHNSRRRHRYPQGKLSQADASLSAGAVTQRESDANDKPRSRRARRKPDLLRQDHESWRSERIVDNHKVHWMITHLWHAKRFHMHHNFFGWNVPLMHINRGAKAVLRLVREHRTMIRDVTWTMQPVLVGASDLQALMASLQRICPGLVPSNSILCGNSFGEGILHDLDQFPAAAIGPAKWWLGSQPLDGSCDRDGWWWMHLFVHPSIHARVQQLVSRLTMDGTLLEGPRHLQNGLACFHLRGKYATRLLCQTLRPSTATVRNASGSENHGLAFDWNDSSTMPGDFHTLLPHLTCMPVEISMSDDRVFLEDKDPVNPRTREECLANIDKITSAINAWKPTKGGGAMHVIQGAFVLLVSQCPCDPSLFQNEPVCGWNLFCHPSLANSILMAFTQQSDACPVGIVEDALIRLDCEPPLPMFPRDYPDTDEGSRYWSGKAGDWTLFRKCLEGGWGRIPVVQWSQHREGKQQVRPISWGSVAVFSEGSAVSNPSNPAVVVRGDFGRPFLDVLLGSGLVPSSELHEVDENLKPKRRNRRQTRHPSVPVQTLLQSEEHSKVHCDICTMLFQSLSVPALIRCHIFIHGTGIIMAGSNIISFLQPGDNDSANKTIEILIGMAVAGSFSPCRGSVHGVGFIGAARFLHVLRSNAGASSTMVTRRADGKKEISLKAILRNPSSNLDQTNLDRTASISLLLQV